MNELNTDILLKDMLVIVIMEINRVLWRLQKELMHSHWIVTNAVICAVESIPKKDHIAIMSENGDLAVYDLHDNRSAE